MVQQWATMGNNDATMGIDGAANDVTIVHQCCSIVVALL